jgi:hypothetical protein
MVGEIISETWARSNRYTRARSSESADLGARLKFPFDTISPAGQAHVAERWDECHAAIDTAKDVAVQEARSALEAFKSNRAAMVTQEEVCWLKDYRAHLTHEQIAMVLEVARPLVVRYVRQREEQLSYRRWWRLEGAA